MTNVITKDKGDTGLIQVIADLNKNGIKVALPISEHLPFDLIAINLDGKLSRISVKYRTINKSGNISLSLRTISSNSQGYKIKYVNMNDVDAFALYCPETNSCYYVHKSKLLKHKSELSLRIKDLSEKAKNSNLLTVNWAKNYLNPNVIFEIGG